MMVKITPIATPPSVNEDVPEIAGDLAGRELFGFTDDGPCRVAGLSGRDVSEYRVVTPPFRPFGRRGKATICRSA